jgi:hypothetical protein
MKIEVVDMIVPANDEDRKCSRRKRLRLVERDLSIQPEHAAAIFEKMNEDPCCDRAEHRTNPQNMDDWRAVDNAMAALFASYTSASAEYIKLLEQVLSELLKRGNLDLSEPYIEHMIGKCSEAGLYQAMLDGHFEIISEKGRSSMADFHYEHVTALVRDHQKAKLERLKEAQAENENQDTAVARKTD